MARAKKQEELPEGASLLFAPTNEEGVKCLFWRYADKKGLRVISVQQGFPDCIVSKKTPRGEKQIRIEFEYRSSSFKAHGHSAADCDWIVCWEHDWRACPSRLKIIELCKEHGLGFRVWMNPVDAPQQRHLELNRVNWAVRNSAHKGDLMLMYRCAPEKCIREVFILESEISEGNCHPDWKVGKCFGGVCRCLCRLDKPLYLEDLRTLGITGRLQGNRDVTERWNSICKLMVARNAKARAKLSKYASK